MGLLGPLRLQNADIEERLHNSGLTNEMREFDQAYLAEIDSLLAAG